jgi:hypothetical protein
MGMTREFIHYAPFILAKINKEYKLLKTSEKERGMIRITLIIALSFYAVTSSSSHAPDMKLDEALATFSTGISGLISPSGECAVNGLKRQEAVNTLLGKLKNSPTEVIEYEGEYLGSLGRKVSNETLRQHLEIWSVYNIDDYTYLRRFYEAESKLKVELERYYVEALKYNVQHASYTAKEAINTILATNVNAFDYYPFDNDDYFSLRKLILSNGDIEDIRKYRNPEILHIPYKLKNYRGGYSPIEKESILSIAVEYSEALRHLLEIGVSPNHQNAFGKTPLMYAVQRNKIEAVKLLLDAGASVNDVTVKTSSSNIHCGFYQLKQYNVSALHYAARYASLDIIKVLLEAGASPNTKSSLNAYGHDLREAQKKVPSGTPLDWFHFFNASKHSEKETLEIEQLLTQENAIR